MKGQIAALGHQTSELQRRETESRAEINILTAAMAAAQHQYQQEMKDAQTKHQVCQGFMTGLLACTRNNVWIYTGGLHFQNKLRSCCPDVS